MMQVVSRGFADLSTSLAIATSIWLLRKKARWNRLRMAWVLRLRGPQGPAELATPARAVAPLPTPIPTPQPLPVSAHRRALRSVPTPLAHIEVVEDTDWHLWEAAVASQAGQRSPGRPA